MNPESWRTTLAGLALLLTTAGNLLSAIAAGTPVDLGAALAGCIAALGLILAKDSRP